MKIKVILVYLKRALWLTGAVLFWLLNKFLWDKLDKREQEAYERGLSEGLERGHKRGMHEAYDMAEVEAARRFFGHSSIDTRAHDLVYDAKLLDKVVTIELVPSTPLAMGNYHMVASVRDRSYRKAE